MNPVRDDGPAADLRRVEAAIAEGEVLEDLLRGLGLLRRGDLGHPARAWGGRVFRRGTSVSTGLASWWGAEQIVKAVRASRPFVASLAELAPSVVPATCTLLDELAALRLGDLPGELDDPATTLRSEALGGVAERVGRGLAALTQARQRLVLQVMRDGMPGQPDQHNG